MGPPTHPNLHTNTYLELCVELEMKQKKDILEETLLTHQPYSWQFWSLQFCVGDKLHPILLLPTYNTYIVAKSRKYSTNQILRPQKLAPKTRDLRHFQIRDKTA